MVGLGPEQMLIYKKFLDSGQEQRSNELAKMGGEVPQRFELKAELELLEKEAFWLCQVQEKFTQSVHLGLPLDEVELHIADHWRRIRQNYELIRRTPDEGEHVITRKCYHLEIELRKELIARLEELCTACV